MEKSTGEDLSSSRTSWRPGAKWRSIFGAFGTSRLKKEKRYFSMRSQMEEATPVKIKCS
jgi:hypothetical protein